MPRLRLDRRAQPRKYNATPFQRPLQQDEQQPGAAAEQQGARTGWRPPRAGRLRRRACAQRPVVPMRRKPKAQNSSVKIVAPSATAPIRWGAPSWPTTAVLVTPSKRRGEVGQDDRQADRQHRAIGQAFAAAGAAPCPRCRIASGSTAPVGVALARVAGDEFQEAQHQPDGTTITAPSRKYCSAIGPSRSRNRRLPE